MLSVNLTCFLAKQQKLFPLLLSEYSRSSQRTLLHKYSVFHKQIRRSFPFLTLLHLQNGYRSTDLSYSHKYFILIFILVSKSCLTHKCSRGQANILFLKDKLTYECTNIIYKPNIQTRCYFYSLFIEQ